MAQKLKNFKQITVTEHRKSILLNLNKQTNFLTTFVTEVDKKRSGFIIHRVIFISSFPNLKCKNRHFSL